MSPKNNKIITYINSFSPLAEGDLIMTGTPEGVGNIKKGDNFSFELSQLEINECGQL